MRLLLVIFLVLSAFALLSGFAGSLHPAGDSLAVARPLLAALVAVLSLLALAARPRRLGATGLALAAASALTLMPPGPGAAGSARTYLAYQKNVHFRLSDLAPLASDIRATGADFVMLQELHRNTRPILSALRPDYPHQSFCAFAAVGGVAVLSRWPSTGAAPICTEGGGLAAMQVATPDGPLWIASLHLHWPFPFAQADQVASLLPVLEGLGGPVLLAGDFNMVPWGHSVRTLAEASRTTPAGYAGGTFAFSRMHRGRNLAELFPRLPIDHVLIPDTGTPVALDRRDRLGSDHHGLLATFALAPPTGS
ncbi:MAG: endonuclease/exonuclease/phosphatase family protein [Silicimonas sp.]|nr:endonuclease/exonuclease/phosphatase family protein [Silicimonas sp.]